MFRVKIKKILNSWKRWNILHKHKRKMWGSDENSFGSIVDLVNNASTVTSTMKLSNSVVRDTNSTYTAHTQSVTSLVQRHTLNYTTTRPQTAWILQHKRRSCVYNLTTENVLLSLLALWLKRMSSIEVGFLLS